MTWWEDFRYWLEGSGIPFVPIFHTSQGLGVLLVFFSWFLRWSTYLFIYI